LQQEQKKEVCLLEILHSFYSILGLISILDSKTNKK
jgi:hypothetical protein